tara:strand:+ start:2181 stop:2537 length:357 start_codon:yes stop_codon:yes gene_type:complete
MNTQKHTDLYRLCLSVFFAAGDDEITKALEVRTEKRSNNVMKQTARCTAIGSGGNYDVSIHLDRYHQTSCSCPHFVYRLAPKMRKSANKEDRRRACKHVLALAKHYLQWSTPNECDPF